MIWFIIKSLVLAILIIYIAFGILTLTYAIISCALVKLINKPTTVILITLFTILLGGVCWSFLGMYISSIAYQLSDYMPTWLSITLMTAFAFIVTHQTNKTDKALTNEIPSSLAYVDLLDTNGKFQYWKFIQVIVANFFTLYILIFISFVVFLFLDSYSNTISFGLINLLLSIIK